MIYIEQKPTMTGRLKVFVYDTRTGLNYRSEQDHITTLTVDQAWELLQALQDHFMIPYHAEQILKRSMIA